MSGRSINDALFARQGWMIDRIKERGRQPETLEEWEALSREAYSVFPDPDLLTTKEPE